MTRFSPATLPDPELEVPLCQTRLPHPRVEGLEGLTHSKLEVVLSSREALADLGQFILNLIFMFLFLFLWGIVSFFTYPELEVVLRPGEASLLQSQLEVALGGGGLTNLV